MTVDTPHLAFPFSLDGGKVALVEQDTPEHVAACVQVILRCPTGFREDRPEFGWPFPEFPTIPVSTQAAEDAVRRWEPRATPRAAEYADTISQAVRHIAIDLEVQGG